MQVALKFLASGRGAFDTTEDASRVATEARVLSSIRHPHIIELLEVVVAQVHSQPGRLNGRERESPAKPQGKGSAGRSVSPRSEAASPRLTSEVSTGASDSDARASGPTQRCSVLVLQYAPGGNLKQEIRRRSARSKDAVKSHALAMMQELNGHDLAKDGHAQDHITSGPRLTLPMEVQSAGGSSAGGSSATSHAMSPARKAPPHWQEQLRLGLYGAYSESEAGHIANQLAAALAVLHAQSVAHLDVKPDNVLLTAPSVRGSRLAGGSIGSSSSLSRRPHGIHILLTDFGLA